LKRAFSDEFAILNALEAVPYKASSKTNKRRRKNETAGITPETPFALGRRVSGIDFR